MTYSPRTLRIVGISVLMVAAACCGSAYVYYRLHRSSAADVPSTLPTVAPFVHIYGRVFQANGSPATGFSMVLGGSQKVVESDGSYSVIVANMDEPIEVTFQDAQGAAYQRVDTYEQSLSIVQSQKNLNQDFIIGPVGSNPTPANSPTPKATNPIKKY